MSLRYVIIAFYFSPFLLFSSVFVFLVFLVQRGISCILLSLLFLQKKFCSIKKVAKNNKYKSILVKNIFESFVIRAISPFSLKMFCLLFLRRILPFYMTLFLMCFLLLSFSPEISGIWNMKKKEWLNIFYYKTHMIYTIWRVLERLDHIYIFMY